MQVMESPLEQSYTVRQVPQVIYFRIRRPQPEKLYTATVPVHTIPGLAIDFTQMELL